MCSELQVAVLDRRKGLNPFDRRKRREYWPRSFCISSEWKDWCWRKKQQAAVGCIFAFRCTAKKKKKRLALVYTEIDKGQGGEEEWEAMSRNPICGTSRCSGNLCGTAKVNSARGKKQQNCNPVCKNLREEKEWIPVGPRAEVSRQCSTLNRWKLLTGWTSASAKRWHIYSGTVINVCSVPLYSCYFCWGTTAHMKCLL